MADLVFLNSVGWGFPVPSPGKRIAAGLAARHRVLYVEPARNVAREGFRASRRQVEDRLWVQERRRVPLYFARRVEPLATLLVRINADLAVSQIAGGSRALDFVHPVICNALVPGVSVSVCDRLGARAVIYFATDVIDGMEEPGAVVRREQEWLERADCVVCSSESLARRLSGPGRRVELLPNGADVGLFEEAAGEQEPTELSGLSRPRAAYAGTVDDRCDVDAIRAVADVMPVVVLGHATSREALSRLRSHRNVHYVGAVPQHAVPAFLGAADVLLMPYVDNRATRFIYPQKLHEYLATGRPVVASRLPSLAAFDGLVTLASTDGFGDAALESATRRDDGAGQRVLAARANSWDRRVEQFDRPRANSWDRRVEQFDRLVDELAGVR
jgi:glycosyltransferase involved in cell wall biosynthesis